MKKIILIVISFTLMFSLISCGTSLIVLDGVHEGYYFEIGNSLYGDEYKSYTVTNYHPYKLWALPDYQELVQYGYVGLENEGIVYFIYIVDTSIDPDDPRAYYTAELDGATREMLCEEGEYFSDESLKTETVEKLLDMIDSFK